MWKMIDMDNSGGMCGLCSDVASCQSLTDVPSAKSKWALFGSWTIPTLISISDLIGAFASGMTIKFMYLFFGKPGRASNNSCF